MSNPDKARHMVERAQAAIKPMPPALAMYAQPDLTGFKAAMRQLSLQLTQIQVRNEARAVARGELAPPAIAGCDR